MANEKLSKRMSYVLRHHPETIGITLDEYGWADVSTLLEKLGVTTQELSEVVGTDKSKRFGSRFRFNEDKTMVKANQGHSDALGIKNDMKPINPPFILYHGTSEKVIDTIRKEGLNKMKRQHVHLSIDVDTAKEVAGRRKGKNVILEIEAKAMYADGIKIYLSENGVYLTDFVDPKYIKDGS